MAKPVLLLTSVLALLLSAGFQAPAGAQAIPPQNPAAAAAAPEQPPPPQEFPGIRNFTRVDATFACGGAITIDSLEAVKQAGFRAVVNLRAAGEDGANVEAEGAAAKAAGIVYIWLPFVPASPDPAVVDKFLAAVADPANLPMLIHCASGGRVSMFWVIKRVMVDGWPVDKAMAELPNLSKNVSATLRAFTLDYLKQHGRTPAGSM